MQKEKLSLSQETGFTLIEVTIGLVITTVLIITVSLIVNFSAQANLQTQETVTDIQEGRRVMETIANELKFSNSFEANAITIKDELDGKGELVKRSLEYLNSNDQSCRIYLSPINDIVYMEINSNKVPLSSGPYIQNLNFQFDSNDKTNNTIIITVKLKNNSFSTTVRPLNSKPPNL